MFLDRDSADIKGEHGAYKPWIEMVWLLGREGGGGGGGGVTLWTIHRDHRDSEEPGIPIELTLGPRNLVGGGLFDWRGGG